MYYKQVVCFQFVKVGEAGSNFPSFIFPSLIGRPLIRSAVKVNNVEIKVRITKYICNNVYKYTFISELEYEKMFL